LVALFHILLFVIFSLFDASVHPCRILYKISTHTQHTHNQTHIFTYTHTRAHAYIRRILSEILSSWRVFSCAEVFLCVCEGVHRCGREFEIVCEHFHMLKCMRACARCKDERKRCENERSVCVHTLQQIKMLTHNLKLTLVCVKGRKRMY